MSTPTNLTDVIAVVDSHQGAWGESRMDWDAKANVFRLSRNDAQLAWDVDIFLWATYDPNDDFIYPSVKGWDDLLEKAIEDDSYGELGKAEVLSCLFGLHHRTRIIDGLWTQMFERGVTQKLLGQLLVLEAQNG